ncbi:hypothetical protein TcasGA2_TC008379 [Tribolium castaneum]|uniref:Uncharacterized protein n=1 Tax=Tribolium castaneum TaxID=7070 RepID=D2A1E0_TRICA|nr:hypothetical protein TcasGA2_TC008379 [Tribolium castaneum]
MTELVGIKLQKLPNRETKLYAEINCEKKFQTASLAQIDENQINLQKNEQQKPTSREAPLFTRSLPEMENEINYIFRATKQRELAHTRSVQRKCKNPRLDSDRRANYGKTDRLYKSYRHMRTFVLIKPNNSLVCLNSNPLMYSS